MAKQISIRVGDEVFRAELAANETADAFFDLLPMKLRLSRWGDEYYGSCGVTPEETPDAREIMSPGEIAIWPPGSAFCVFFGPTPASTDERPRAASPVVPIGRLLDDFEALKRLGSSVTAEISPAG